MPLQWPECARSRRPGAASMSSGDEAHGAIGVPSQAGLEKGRVKARDCLGDSRID